MEMFKKRGETILRTVKTGIRVFIGALALLLMAVPAWAEKTSVVFEGVKRESSASIDPNNYSSVEELFNDAQAGDVFTLLKNVETNESITIIAGTKENPVTLDLNGYGIRANASENNPFSVIMIGKEIGDELKIGNLKIVDSRSIDAPTHYYIVENPDTNGAGLATVCEESRYDSHNGTKGTFTGGYITGGKGYKIEMIVGDEETGGGGIYIEGNSSLNMSGCTLIGNEATGGGGIYCNEGTQLSLDNCAVIGNKAKDNSGGGIHAAKTTMYMNGSTVCGNYSNKAGGGIYLEQRATLRSKDSRITGNTAEGSGGGIAIVNGFSIPEGGSDVIDNTVISGNKAGLWGGGGAYIEVSNGSFDMNGGEICHNETCNNAVGGGGVYLFYGKFNMNGGRICNNKTEEGDSCIGGGVCVCANGQTEFNVSGNAVITDNKCGTSPNNVFLRQSSVFVGSIFVNGSLAKESRIGVTTDNNETRTFTSGLPGKGSASNFFSDKKDYIVSLDDKNEAAIFELLTVTLNSNDGSGKSVVQQVGKGALSTLNANPFSPPSGSYFDGWAVTESGKKAYDDGGTVRFTANTVLYARWAYKATVKNGAANGTGSYVKGETVEIKADAPAVGKRFKEWTSDGGVTFADPGSPSTTFTMPAKAVTITAIYEDVAIVKRAPEGVSGLQYNGKEQELITAGEVEGGTLLYALGEDGAFGTGIPKAVEAGDYTVFWYAEGDALRNDTEKEKINVSIGSGDKVPLTGTEAAFAAPEDNFAPVMSSGKTNELVLDFSKVGGSSVDPAGLKMTSINGSKFTTKIKLKDKDSAKAEGGVKVKVNKKTLIPTITCKKDGSVTLTLEDGNTYKIEFRVQKPKAQKASKLINKGSGSVTKTVHDLFGTDIDAGELEILKQKGSQARLFGNSLIVTPDEKDSIKIQYKYLDKKYKMTIRVK